MTISGTGITGSGLAHLAGLGRLKSLTIPNTALDDAGVANLGRLSGLQKLYMGLRGAELCGASRCRALFLVSTRLQSGDAMRNSSGTGLTSTHGNSGVKKLRMVSPELLARLAHRPVSVGKVLEVNSAIPERGRCG